MKNDILNEALRLANLGYRVFPCADGKKTPATENGFHDATDREAVIRTFFNGYKRNLAISAAGLLLVDVDGKDNGWPFDPDRMADLAYAGAIATTPRGGRHYLYRRPEGVLWGCSVSQIAPGVDIRTDGGYFLVAPSKTKDGAYTWAPEMGLDRSPRSLPQPPDWLCEILDSQAGGNAKREKPSRDRVEIEPGEENAIPDGQRNQTLASLAGVMRRAGMSEGEILAAIRATNATRCKPPLNDAEVERIARSICRYEPDPITVAVVEGHYDQMFETGEGKTSLATEPNAEFPTELLQVPGFIGEFCEHVMATSFRKQPVLALAAAICAVGVLTGRKVRDHIGTRTNVYCLGVCPSGGGKERARQAVKEILIGAGAERLVGPEGIASHAGLIAAVSAQPALLLQIDEIGRILKTTASAERNPHRYEIVTNFLKLYSASNSTYLCDGYADTTKNRKIEQPHVCLYGTTVPESLYSSMTTESISDGFLSRMLIFEAPAIIPDKQKTSWTDTPDSLIRFARQWADERTGSGNLAEEYPRPREIATDDDAEQIFDDFDRFSDTACKNVNPTLGTIWTRAGEKARKLALIHACSTRSEIGEDSAIWACAMSKYLSERLVSIASNWIAENQHETTLKRVLRLIADAGDSGVAKNDLMRSTRGLKRADRDEVIETLLESQEIVTRREKTNGRPITKFFRNFQKPDDVNKSSQV